MSVFFKRIFYFAVLILGLIVLINASLSFIERKYSDFKLDEHPKYIVVGHSHPECAFNDSLIPELKNISYSGESYFYSYFKTKQVVQQNPSIEVVFIEFTNNQIVKRMDEWTWGEEFISNSYPKYSSFMNTTDNFFLFRKPPFSYINAFTLSVKDKFERVSRKEFDYSTQLDGYLYLERDKTDSIIKNTPGLENMPNTSEKDVSLINLSYLDALIEFCKNNGKEVVLIRSPQHEKYFEYKNEKTYLEILHTRYKNIPYIDFSKFPLSDAEYGDLEHLNYKGAKIFSEWFADLLKNGLLKKSKMQDYVNEQMK